MMTIGDLITELEKINNKEMEIAIRTGTNITGISDVFECEADGVPFICIDSENNCCTK